MATEKERGIGIGFAKTGERFVGDFAARRVKAVAKSTREWAGELARDRNPFFFSAKCSDAKLLEAMKHYIERDLAGDPAHGRARFVKTMRRLQGVPIDAGDSRRMTDLRSSRRLKLIYDFHARRVREEEAAAVNDTDAHRFAFPYRELYRPGTSHPVAPRNWLARCASVGFEIRGGRIFAPRDSILWRQINRFGFDHPPFDFNSGMDVRYVSRAEADALGLKLPKLAAAAKNPAAMNPEVEERERERQKYFDANAEPDAEARRFALEEIDRPGLPYSMAEARTLPTSKFAPPEAFENAEAAKAYLDRKWNALAEAGTPTSLPREQISALKRYTDNSSKINKALREGRKDSKDIGTLRAAFKDSQFGMDVETVRTASVAEARDFLGFDFDGDVDARLLTLESSGRKNVFKSVMSTSAFARYSPKGLAQRDGVAVEYRVSIPRGAHAMFLDPISTKGPYGLSGSTSARKAPPRLWSEDGKNTETEVAIAPESKFVVEKHEWRTENGLQKLILWLTLVR